jgi:hypothetical protein
MDIESAAMAEDNSPSKDIRLSRALFIECMHKDYDVLDACSSDRNTAPAKREACVKATMELRSCLKALTGAMHDEGISRSRLVRHFIYFLCF